MAKTFKEYLLIIVAALSFVLMPAAANAQYVQLSCNNNGNAAGGQLYYADATNNQGACQYQGIQHVFSQIICDFVVILNNVLGQVYCGIQYSLTPVLAILLSLYIIVFGAQILMGTAQLNAKEIIIRLLKIAGVWTFATESTWGIGLIFQFFAGAASEGSMWVINSIHTTDLNAITSDPNLMPVADANGDYMPMYAYLDNLIYAAILGPFTTANDKVTGFFIVLIFFFPILFGMVVSWTLSTVMMLARTLVDFLLCLSAIAFLIALSPIFLSFMLFEVTKNYFEDWLKYLISYTLQIVIVFAIISLWIATMSIFGGFFNELSALIYPIGKVDVVDSFSPNATYGICPYIETNTVPPSVPYAPPGQVCPTTDPNFPNCCITGLPCLPSVQCDPNNPPTNANLITPSQLEFHEDFIYFMAYNLTALIIIAYTFGVLIKHAPDIAKQLSGPAQMPELGGGFGMKGFGQMLGGSSGGGNRGGGGAAGRGGSTAPPAPTGKPGSDFIESARKLLTAGRNNPPGGRV